MVLSKVTLARLVISRYPSFLALPCPYRFHSISHLPLALALALAPPTQLLPQHPRPNSSSAISRPTDRQRTCKRLLTHTILPLGPVATPTDRGEEEITKTQFSLYPSARRLLPSSTLFGIAAFPLHSLDLSLGRNKP